jgi:hypothetical protein
MSDSCGNSLEGTSRSDIRFELAISYPGPVDSLPTWFVTTNDLAFVDC